MKKISRRQFIETSVATVGGALLSSVAISGEGINSKAKTGYAFHPDFESFENNSSETWLRAKWINSRLESTGVTTDTVSIAPFNDPMSYIKKVHNQSHIDLITGMPVKGNFTLSIGEAAQIAVGYVLGSVDSVCSGNVRNAFCCIRPPGHHAENSGWAGYCCYANIVIAAHFAREKFGISRILIVDWDYHHGNSTHSLLCEDNNIFFFETFGAIVYTTGCSSFMDVGPEHIFPDNTSKMNIRMPSASTNDDFVKLYESKLVTAMEKFKPQLVLISCGFDLKKYDTHGTFNVTANGISRMTRIVKQIADTYADGKFVSMLEGGYQDSSRDSSISGSASTFSGLSQCAENHVKTLLTGDVQPETPYYSQSISIAMRTKSAHDKGIIVNNGILTGVPPDFGPYTLTLASADGKIVKTIINLNIDAVNLKAHGFSKGMYLITFKGMKKTIVKHIVL